MVLLVVEWYPPPSNRFLRVTSPMNSELGKRMGTNQEKLLDPSDRRDFNRVGSSMQKRVFSRPRCSRVGI
eukprot:SAG11_NODE_3167_length_2638_cov_4.451359_4_plen_69_part_01